MNNNIKVSFDFDGTLSASNDVREYAKLLVDSGYDVYIITRRFDSIDKYTEELIKEWNIQDVNLEHNFLFKVADDLGIKKENIKFLNLSPKFKFFSENKDFAFHLDNDLSECLEINNNSNGIFSVYYSTTSAWKSFCNSLIQRCKNGE